MKRIVSVLAVLGLSTVAYLTGVSAASTARADDALQFGVKPIKYGYNAEGTITGLGPFVANGVVTLLPDGSIAAVETANVNNTIYHTNYTGSYTISPDNTGTLTTIDPYGGVSHFSVVFTSGRQRATGVQDDDIVLLKLERQ